MWRISNPKQKLHAQQQESLFSLYFYLNQFGQGPISAMSLTLDDEVVYDVLGWSVGGVQQTHINLVYMGCSQLLCEKQQDLSHDGVMPLFMPLGVLCHENHTTHHLCGTSKEPNIEQTLYNLCCSSSLLTSLVSTLSLPKSLLPRSMDSISHSSVPEPP